MEERRPKRVAKRFGPLVRLMKRRDTVKTAIGGLVFSFTQPAIGEDSPPPGPILEERKDAFPSKKEEALAPAPTKAEPKREVPAPIQKKDEPKQDVPKTEWSASKKQELKKEIKRQIDVAELRDVNYDSDLLKQIEDMRDKRDDMSLKILKHEDDAAKLRKEIAGGNNRLSKLENMIVQRRQQRAELDKAITEAEAELFKILEASSGLLDKLKRKVND